jgi:DNA-binding response OmpR family regulator
MGLNVLIVDDSKLARMAVAKALNAIRPDWTRLEASSAQEAHAVFERSHIDLTLLDFNMPDVDGLTLAAQLRAAHPDMPIALISANHQNEVVARATAIGAAFLPKPLTQAALSAFLEAVTDPSRADAL